MALSDIKLQKYIKMQRNLTLLSAVDYQFTVRI